MDPDAGLLRLSIPATGAYLATARLFGVAAARQLGARDDAVEDIRLAISEACAIALREARSPTAIQLTIRSTSDGIAVGVRTELDDTVHDDVLDATGDDDVEPADAELDARWGTDLLRAIVSSFTMERDDEGRVTLSFVSDADHGGPRPTVDALTDRGI